MKRDEAIELLEDLYGAIEDNHGRDYDEAFRMAIKALQTIDNCDQCEWCCPSDGIPTIHVVRCKDCKYGRYDVTHYFCAEHGRKVYEDDFCSQGERICNNW